MLAFSLERRRYDHSSITNVIGGQCSYISRLHAFGPADIVDERRHAPPHERGRAITLATQFAFPTSRRRSRPSLTSFALSLTDEARIADFVGMYSLLLPQDACHRLASRQHAA